LGKAPGGKSAASGPSAAAESPVPIGISARFLGRWCRGGEARSAPQLTFKAELPKAGQDSITILQFALNLELQIWIIVSQNIYLIN